jgi:hypothetical protein
MAAANQNHKVSWTIQILVWKLEVVTMMMMMTMMMMTMMMLTIAMTVMIGVVCGAAPVVMIEVAASTLMT